MRWDTTDRPPDELTITELRYAIAALAGPLRIHIAGRSREVVLRDARPVNVAENRMSGALYVEIRGMQDQAHPIVLVGSKQNLSPSDYEPIDLEAGPFAQILGPSESMYVRSTVDNEFRILVSEVTV